MRILRLKELDVGTLYKCLVVLFIGLSSAPYLYAAGPDAPELASVAAVAVDVATGKVLVAKHADAALSIASVTKLMTAVVVLDGEADLEQWLTILDWDAATAKNAYSRIRLTSQAQRGELLRIALMSSENRAAFNLAANATGGIPTFVRQMNDKAATLGMTNSRFVDPTGLSPNNRSTARDLAKLLVAAADHPAIREYSTTRQRTARFRKPRYTLGYGNTNRLVHSSRWDVVLSKTGYLTEAGRCLVMVTTIDGKDIAMVMLNSFGTRSPLGDAGRIKRFIQTGDKGRVAGAAGAYARETAERLGLVSGG
jgi:D-alanyl-D-alanine endopeptidase (penicillin-binding protein 7)